MGMGGMVNPMMVNPWMTGIGGMMNGGGGDGNA